MKNKKAYVIKTIVSTKNGVPDIICCYKGRFIGFEVKKDAQQKATDLQLYNLQKIWEAGGEGYVVSSLGQVINVIENQN